MNKEKIKLIIVDDNIIYRESLKDLLINKFQYEVLAEANDGVEFLNLSKNLQPDVVLMDLSMPKMDGFETTKKYFWEFPNSKIIAVTNHIEQAYLLQLIQAGFKGCVYKNNLYSEIGKAIETVLGGKLWFPDKNQI